MAKLLALLFRERQRWLWQRWALITLAIGLILTLFATRFVHEINQQHIAEAVEDSADPLFERITERLNTYIYGLQEARTAVIAGGGPYITYPDFHRFGETLDLVNSFPGSRGFGFVRRVPQAQVQYFIAEAKADGREDFAIQEIYPNQDDRFVLQYLEPHEVSTNYQAIGLDIGSEVRRRQAAMLAMQTGNARMTAPIELQFEQKSEPNSFLMLLPIYTTGVTPATLEEREASCYGWLIAPLNLMRVLGDLNPDAEYLAFSITDLTDSSMLAPFFHNGMEDGLFPMERQIDLLGRTWRFQLGVTPAYIDRLHLFSESGTAIAGAIFTILAMISVSLFNVQLLSRRHLIQEQTKLHAIVESSADGIIGKTIDGVVMSWNSGAEKIFGFSAKEAIGKPLKELVFPERLKAEEPDILARVATGETISAFESVRKRKDGTEFPVSATVSPIYNASGEVIGAAKTVRDISRQKLAEAKIRELNNNLEKQVAKRTEELADLNLLFKTVLSAASEFCIIATDTEGVVQVFNHGAERMLGYSSEEMVGKQTPVVLHDPREVIAKGKELSEEYKQNIEAFDVFVFRATRDETDYQEWTYIAKDGRRFPCRLVVSAMRDEFGTIIGFLGIGTDITEEKLAEEKLSAARDQLLSTTQTLLTASRTAGLGIWQINIADNAVTWNDKMYELYQVDKDEQRPITFAQWQALIHPEDVEATLNKLNSVVEDNFDSNVIFRIVLNDSSTRVIQGGAAVERNSQGMPLRLTGINIDITEDQLLQQRLIEAKEDADAASAAKSMFLANMSHEIRTPMNAVLGMLQLLLKTPLQPKQRDFASKARIAATSLLGLLNDILDYSKIESGKLELDPHPFDFNALMQHLAVVMTGNLRDKSIELLFDFDEQLPPHLIGDELRLQQVLINLLSNAIKFTEKGEVIVKTRVQQLTDQEVTFEIGVTDSGIGISPEQQQRIFEGFTQAEASITRRYGGTGLGLVICRRLVSLMGGELLLHSALGEGSCFYFSITLPINQQISWHPTQLPSHPKILVVDDNPVARTLASEALKRLDAEVDDVSDGEEAVHRLKQAQISGRPYDCVLLDWLMPNMDGLCVAESAYQQLPSQDLPKFILISAANHEDLPALSQSCPIDLVLSKPVTCAQLAQAVTDVLAGACTQRLDNIADHWSETLKDWRILLVEDNSFNQAVATELLTGEGAEVIVAEDGQAGLNKVRELGETFDVVLMDMQMPKMDGLTATRLIRKEVRFAELPIIAMTANVSQQDKEDCIAAGMNAHLAKPLDFPEVLATLRNVVHRKIPENTLSFKTSAKSVPSATDTDGRLANVLQRFGGNAELYRKLLSSFKLSFAGLIAELESAIAQQLWQEAQVTLHTMKGTAGTAGLSSLYDALVEKEKVLKNATDADKASVLAGTPAQFSQLADVEYLELQQLLGDETTTIPVALPVEGDIAGLMQEIDECLHSGNMKAIELVSDLSAIASPPMAELCQQLLQLTENLAFEDAQTCLHKLRSVYEA